MSDEPISFIKVLPYGEDWYLVENRILTTSHAMVMTTTNGSSKSFSLDLLQQRTANNVVG